MIKHHVGQHACAPRSQSATVHMHVRGGTVPAPPSILSLWLLQVEAAVAAAKEAFPAWSQRSPEQRATVLNRLAELIQDNLEDLAQAESRDQGAC